MFLAFRKIIIVCLLFGSNISFAKSQTYIFISFSMNDEALKSYYEESKKYKAILVMRGLKDNSFQVTQNKTIVLEISFDIDPNLFEQYQIMTVPVILHIDDKQQEIKRITGHIPLKDALEIMEVKT
ncbi:MAG TPA: type-F conjugative transfer system pilin assembly protein TrbC [Rickettsia endosymbiont of Omalisus fontisbellaquei]|nr:type-F conjugative transfer system pilin assembly protein TrbC [Rickettsia endosymbiont of Omalisus fontisbellaquei]